MDTTKPEPLNPNPLLGTWKLKAYFVTNSAGSVSFPYGDNPTGYISYSVEGRMQVIATASGRPQPSEPTPPDSTRIALYDTMFAYGGTYSVEADVVIHHVDVSWNEAWTGTKQTRRYQLIGDTLMITMSILDPATSTEVRYTAEWERIGRFSS